MVTMNNTICHHRRKPRSRGSVRWIAAALIAVVVLFASIPAYAAIGASLVTSIADGTDTSSYNFPSATYSNNVLYIAYTSTSCASGQDCGLGVDMVAAVESVSGAGLTFTEIGPAGGVEFSTNGRRIQAWRALATSGATTGAVTVTMQTGTISASMGAAIIEFTGTKTSGTNGADAVVQWPTNSASGVTALTVNMAAFANSNNRPVAFFSHRADSGTEATNHDTAEGYTELHDGPHGSVMMAHMAEWHETAANTTPSADWGSSSGATGGFALEIAAATSTTTRTVAIHPSGTTAPLGYDATYTSMSAMEAAEDGDLVALNRFLRVEIVNSDGDWTTADTTVIFDGWKTNKSAGQYVEIEVMSGARNPYTDGKWSTSHYRLSSSSSTIALLIDNDAAAGSYFEADFIGLQVENTGGGLALQIRDGAYHKTIKFKACHFRGTAAFEVIQLMDNGTAEVWFINSILENSLSTNDDEILRATSAWQTAGTAAAYFYNCTVVGGGLEGLDVSAGTIVVKNCAVFNNGTTDINQSGATVDYVASDASVGTNWVDISPAAEADGWNAAVTDYVNGDYRVKDSNSVLYLAGLSQSSDPDVPTEDIAGNARPTGSDQVSIGAFEARTCGRNLVMVVGTDTSQPYDAAKQALFEGWEWTVSSINDTDSQTVFNNAAANNNVMYISESVSSGNVNTKARDLNIGIVDDECWLWDEMEYGPTGNGNGDWGTTINIIEPTSHYITDRFPTGSQTVYSTGANINNLPSSLASGGQLLGQTPNGGDPTLFAFDTGATLDSGTAANRRVGFPSFDSDPANWTLNLKTLLQRSLDWAAGCGEAGGGGGTNLVPAAANDSFSTDEDVNLVGNVLTNDTLGDPSNTVTEVSGVSNGVLTLNADGSFTYDPDVGFSGTDSFTYRLTDNDSETSDGTVTITVNPAGGTPVPNLDDYSCNMKITVNSAKVAADLNNFPVLIQVTDDSLTTTGCGFMTDVDGDDLIFTNSSKTVQLDHELEKYDNTTGELVAWVEVPFLSGSSNTDIYMYFGNSNVTTPTENPTGVWDANYAGVWHLGEDAATVAPTTAEWRISNDADDSEETISSGSIDWGSSDLELGEEGSAQIVGMRWRNITIPQGATITSAYIEFTVDEVQTGTPANVTFYGEAADNAVAFENVAYNISSAHYNNPTSASVAWNNIPGWDTVGQTKQSPDIKTIIQEIVDRGGWVSGNSLVVLVTGSGRRTADSHDSSPSTAPLLHVEYTTVTDLHLDSTANDNDGIPNGNTLTASGMIEGAQIFDGVDDWIEVPNSSSLDITGDEITLSAWVKMTAGQTVDAGIINKSYSNNYNYMLNVQGSDQANFRVRTGGTSTYLTGATTLSAGQWYFIYGIYDGATAKVYLDGSEDGSDIRTGNIESSGAAPVVFGRRRVYPTVDDRFFNGVIDEVRISNVARSTQWMLTEYNNQSDPSSFYSVQKNCPSTIPPIAEFACSIPITIDSSKVSGTSDLIDFPVLIDLTNVSLRTTANCGYVQSGNGYDIIFSDATQTTILDHEIDKYDGNSGELVAWVRIPTLSATLDTTIYVHFGHSDVCGATENPTDVWDDNYKGVWHLSDTSGDTQDSTSYNTNGVVSGASRGATGKIGDAFDFGDSDEVDWGNPADDHLDADTGNWTVSLWANIDNNRGAGAWEKIINKGKNSWETGYEMELDDTANNLYFAINDGSTEWGRSTGVSFSLDTWTHFVGVVDRTNDLLRLYKDGVQVDTSGISGYGDINQDNGDTLTIGKSTWGWPDARIDEVRVSDTARSADWIQTSYNNQNDPSSFYSVGSSSCFLGGFSCNRQITIPKENVSGGSDLSNFPLLIKIENDCNLRTTANGGSVQKDLGWDIIFTDSTGITQLDHELVNYDPVTGDLVAWVKIPLLSASSDTDIKMYYGNGAISCDPSNPTGVWDSSNYAAVWHLDETSGTHYDSTSNDNDATPLNGVSQNTIGKIDGADDFDGTDDYVNIGQPANGSLDFEENTDFCISAWFKADSADHNMTIVGQRRQTSIALGTYDSSADKIYFRMDDSAYHYSDSGISLDQWTHVALCYDFVSDATTEGYSYMYVDGVAQSTNGLNTYDTMDPDEWRIGDERRWCPTCGSVGPDELFDGIIDEVRISNTLRTVGWFKTSYDNQKDPSLFYQMSNDTCGGQYGFDFTYCKKVTVDYTQVSGATDLSDFPLLVNITSNDLKSVANGGRVASNQGWDIVFRDSGCTKLEHEIEKYDPTTGTLVAWVKTALSVSTDTEIYMYYGDSLVNCATENPTGVWGDNYVGVWHLHDDFVNSIDNNSATESGSVNDTGQIADGQNFDDSSDNAYATVSGLPSGSASRTLSSWFKPSSSTVWENGGFLGYPYNGYSGGTNNWFELSYSNSDIGASQKFVLHLYGTNYASTNTFGANNWYHVVATYDGSSVKMYVNDVLEINQTVSLNTAVNPSGFNFNIGTIINQGVDTPRDGIIDEVRISNVARSADWITTEYNNQSNPNFYSVGSCFEQTMTQEWVEEVQ